MNRHALGSQILGDILVIPADGVISRMVAVLDGARYDQLARTSTDKGLTQNGQACSPSVVLIDATRSLEAGIVELRSMRQRHKGDTKYLMVGRPLKTDELIELIRTGLDGYLRLQDLTPDNLDRTIRALRAEEFAIPRSLVGSLASFIRSEAHSARMAAHGENRFMSYGFTAREREVLRLIVEGARDRDIAEHLMISLPTANRHVHNILSKLQVRSRGAATRKLIAENAVAEAGLLAMLA